MKLQRGFGVLHILLILVVAIGGAVYWKYQQRKAVELTNQQAKQQAEQEAAENLQEQQRLAKINAEVSEAHRQELEIQKRVYESVNSSPPIHDQSDLTSKSLPYLAWEASRIDMSKPEIREFAAGAKKFISSSLKDPDSAKFADMKILKASHADGSYTFICGKVNAKNSFGGYTGFENYVVYKDKSGAINGGVGDAGFLATIRSDNKWWRYDADDMCLVYGFAVEG